MKKTLLLLAACITGLISFAAPFILYSPLHNSCGAGDKVLSGVEISDVNGVPITGANVPRIYYRKIGQTWLSQPGTFVSGTATNSVWDFVIPASDLSTLTTNDVVEYYVVAQDILATPSLGFSPAGGSGSGVNSVTFAPAQPNTFAFGNTLSGTYTVGVSGNFATLNDACKAYNNGCLQGAVVFELIDATYTVSSQLALRDHADASATNTLTIRPAAGVQPTVNGAVSGPLFRIIGSYVTIDGKNNLGNRSLTLRNAAGIIALASPAFQFNKPTNTDIAVINCILANTYSNYHTVLISSVTSPSDQGLFRNVRIFNNDIRGGYYGIFAAVNGNSSDWGRDIEFSYNNIDREGAEANRNVGIYLRGGNGVLVSHNSIGNLNDANDEDDIGIWIDVPSINTIVESNRITNLSFSGSANFGAQGISVTSGMSASGIVIRNNFISNIRTKGYSTAIVTANPIGISLRGSQDGISIQHNTIHLYGNTINQTAAFSMGVYLGSGSRAALENNIIVNNLGLEANPPTGSFAPFGSVGVFAASGISQFTSIHHNDYFAGASGAGTKAIGRIGSTAYNTLAEWTAATGETGSVNILPVFVADTDLHLKAIVSNAPLNNLGSASSVTRDIDNELRSGTPDMGADEFIPPCVAPVITQQPRDTAVCSTSSPVLSVTATGSGLTYQWRKNGVAITGATSASYTLTNISAGGTYDVIVTNSCNSVTSSGALVQVFARPVANFTVSANNCSGSSVSFTNTSTPAPAISGYSWIFGDGDISATENPTHAYTTAGSFNVLLVASDIHGCKADSITKSVQVRAATDITVQPASKIVCEGSSVSFSVTGTGSNISYQWRKASQPIAGANGDTYTISATAAGDAGNYDVIVSGDCGVAISNTVSLNFKKATAILTQPASKAVCAGTAASFTVIAEGDALTYQWKKAGVAIAGATSATYSIASPAAADQGNYTVTVTGTCGSVTSAAATLTINAATAITTQPASLALCPGSTANFSVVATGQSALSYQWKKNGVAIAGAINNTFSIANITASDAASYTVDVTAGCGTVTSAAATLSLNPATTITTQPQAQSVCPGTAVTFTTVASGQGTLTYQWKKDGVAITGATSASYAIPTFASADAGSYTVEVTGSCGTVISNGAALSVSTTGCVTAVLTPDPDVAVSLLMPNRVETQANLRIKTTRTMKIEWQLVNASGVTVQRFTQNIPAGSVSDKTLQLSGLARGSYQLHGVTSQGKSIHVKFIKL